MLGVSVATILAVLDFMVAKIYLGILRFIRYLIRYFSLRCCFSSGKGTFYNYTGIHFIVIQGLKSCGTQNDFQQDFFKNDLSERSDQSSKDVLYI